MSSHTMKAPTCHLRHVVVSDVIIIIIIIIITRSKIVTKIFIVSTVNVCLMYLNSITTC